MQLEKKNVETRMSAANLNLPIPTIKLALIKVFKLVFQLILKDQHKNNTKEK